MRSSLRRILAALLLLCLLPLGAAAETLEVKEQLHPDLPPFLFRLSYHQDGMYWYVETITILREDGNLVQSIALETPAETFDNETLSLGFEDMNFDGYADMYIMQYVSLGSSLLYHCWLWDPATQQFVYNMPLSQIPSPTFDQNQQLVHGHSREASYDPLTQQDYSAVRNGATKAVETHYTYIGGVPVLIGQTSRVFDLDGHTAITIIESIVDGEMMITDIQREEIDPEQYLTPEYVQEEYGRDPNAASE